MIPTASRLALIAIAFITHGLTIMQIYGGYVDTLGKRFAAAFSTIETGYNLDYGLEFELALCNVLRDALPAKYGVARGFAVDKYGNIAGDDVVIFEQLRFPTVAVRHVDEMLRKEKIPIEAIYCYIEAKHTVNILGDDSSSNSLSHATNQVVRVKQLCSKREPLEFSRVIDGVTLIGEGVQISGPDGYPGYKNPMFAMVVARNVTRKENDRKPLSGQQIYSELSDFRPTWVLPHAPDVLILGEDVVVLPISANKIYTAPFISSNNFTPRVVTGKSYGIGFCALMQALDFIQLGSMHWHTIIANELELPTSDFGSHLTPNND